MWAQRLGNIFHFLSNRLDGKNVVFGSVVEGMELIRQMEELGSEYGGKPDKYVVIADCGEVTD
jgi:cyclophilin family peptidyl-prolyl cis-trans isomerase